MAKVSTKGRGIIADGSAVPQSTIEIRVALPCSLTNYYPYAKLAWGYCLLDLERFAKEAGRFTTKFIEERVAQIDAVQKMPSLSGRLAEATEANVPLQAKYQALGDMARRLGIAIDYVYKSPKVAAAERKESGLTDFEAASKDPWSTASNFVVTCNTYLETKGDKLVSGGAVTEQFATDFKAIGAEFDAAWTVFKAKEKAVQTGTSAVQKGLESIKEELDSMLKLGRVIFKYDPSNAKRYMEKYLLNEVRNKHHAGVQGIVTVGPKDEKTAGVRVQMDDDTENFTFTNKKGQYELKVAAGTHYLTFTSEKTLPLTVTNKVVKPGVMGRLSVKLELKPVEEAVEPSPEPPSEAPIASVSSAVEVLKEIVRENGVLEKVD